MQRWTVQRSVAFRSYKQQKAELFISRFNHPTPWGDQMYSRPKPNRGFTLVELIVAIGIMAVLAGMLMGGISVARKAVKKSQAATLISSLELACKVFENEWGFFPHDENNTNLVVTIPSSASAYSGLTYKSGAENRPIANAAMMLQLLTQKKNGPYFEPNENDIVLQIVVTDAITWNSQFKESSSGFDYAPVILDPWGMPFMYDRNRPEGTHDLGQHNIKSIDLYSYGPNTLDEDGAGDDINNW
ncbi:MAG: prepilin-type N-terminal cleavage/methylation domain-containing protein [Planctomycetota bacterium]|nr:prepilin-type N-terminal cleavage/methylation domain-containing protein [Planctomycetota bacterium]